MIMILYVLLIMVNRLIDIFVPLKKNDFKEVSEARGC